MYSGKCVDKFNEAITQETKLLANNLTQEECLAECKKDLFATACEYDTQNKNCTMHKSFEVGLGDGDRNYICVIVLGKN